MREIEIFKQVEAKYFIFILYQGFDPPTNPVAIQTNFIYCSFWQARDLQDCTTAKSQGRLQMGWQNDSQRACTRRWVMHALLAQPCCASSTWLCAHAVEKGHIAVKDTQQNALHCCLLLLQSFLPVLMVLFVQKGVVSQLCCSSWEVILASHSKTAINFAVSSRQEQNKNVHCFPSIFIFYSILTKLEKKESKKVRAGGAQAAMLSHNCWSGGIAQEMQSFHCFWHASHMHLCCFKWCQLLYSNYCHWKYFFKDFAYWVLVCFQCNCIQRSVMLLVFLSVAHTS